MSLGADLNLLLRISVVGSGSELTTENIRHWERIHDSGQ